MINNELKMKDLKDVMSVFKSHKVRAFLSYGAVLGAVREKDFIQWDDDIDIDVVDTISFETRKSIGATLGDLGFIAQMISFNVLGRMELTAIGLQGECRYDGDGETGIIVCTRNFPFSIFFYKEEGDDFVCTPKVGAMKLISNLKKFYEKPASVKLHKETFITPGPLPEYLTYMYGDWKTPQRENAHAPQYNKRNAK